jgi:hypothetical protein
MILVDYAGSFLEWRWKVVCKKKSWQFAQTIFELLPFYDLQGIIEVNTCKKKVPGPKWLTLEHHHTVMFEEVCCYYSFMELY